MLNTDLQLDAHLVNTDLESNPIPGLHRCYALALVQCSHWPTRGRLSVGALKPESTTANTTLHRRNIPGRIVLPVSWCQSYRLLCMSSAVICSVIVPFPFSSKEQNISSEVCKVFVSMGFWVDTRGRCMSAKNIQMVNSSRPTSCRPTIALGGGKPGVWYSWGEQWQGASPCHEASGFSLPTTYPAILVGCSGERKSLLGYGSSNVKFPSRWIVNFKQLLVVGRVGQKFWQLRRGGAAGPFYLLFAQCFYLLICCF